MSYIGEYSRDVIEENLDEREQVKRYFLETYIEENKYEKRIESAVSEKYHAVLDSLSPDNAQDIYQYEVEVFNAILDILSSCPYLEIKI